MFVGFGDFVDFSFGIRVVLSLRMRCVGLLLRGVFLGNLGLDDWVCNGVSLDDFCIALGFLHSTFELGVCLY